MKTCKTCGETKSPELFRTRTQAGRGSWTVAHCRPCENARNHECRDKSNPNVAYNRQKAHAKARGIEFLMSYADWLAFWGDDLAKRGNKGDDLVLCRYGDTGPYSVVNCYLATKRENTSGPRVLA